MTEDSTTTARKASAATQGATVSFWDRPSADLMPKHFPLSAWFGHAPFASWLVDVLRPAQIVELGTHFGFSCFAFAEAAATLGVDIRIDAVDSWQGDDHAGFYDDSVHEYVRQTVEQDYSETVRMRRGLFNEVRPQYADPSIDVLHIDGRHGYEDARDDYEEWRSTVRDGGVILLHDISERQEGFGVWRLWEEIAEPGSSFAFDHSHGLGVLSVGEPSCAPLRDLFECDSRTANVVREYFEDRGERVRLRGRLARLERLEVEMSQTMAALREVNVERARLESELAERDARIAAMHASTSWRVTAPLRALGRRRG